MNTMEVSSAAGSIERFVDDKKAGPLVFMKKGKAVAVLLHINDDDLEDLALSNNPKFIAMLERIRADHVKQGGISSADLKAEFAAKPRAKSKRS